MTPTPISYRDPSITFVQQLERPVPSSWHARLWLWLYFGVLRPSPVWRLMRATVRRAGWAG